MNMGHRVIAGFFLLVIYLFLPSHYYQQTFDYASEYKKAEKLYNSENATDQTDSLALSSYLKTIAFLKQSALNDSMLFDSYMKAGFISMSVKKDNLALTFFLQSLSLKRASTLPDSIYFKAYLFAGTCYYTLFDLDSALHFYKQAEDILHKYPGLSDAERLYNKTGVLYYETGDYQKGIRYFNKALSLVDSTRSNNIYFILNYKNNIASALRKLQEYDQALLLYKSLLAYNINRNELLHNIGVTYLDAGNYAEAIHYLRKVKYNNLVINNDLGRVYWRMERPDSAMIYFNKALSLYKNSGNKQKSLDYGITLKYLGDLFASRNLPLQALEKYQQSIIQFDPDFNDTSLNQNPRSFNGLHQYIFLFDALLAKARAFKMLAEARSDEGLMVTSLNTYGSTLDLATHIERFYNSDEARLFLKKNVDTAYHEYADQGLELYERTKDSSYLEDIFRVIENNKASILQTDLHELELGKIPGLPLDLLQQEKNLKREIARLNIQSAQASEDSLQTQLSVKIRDLEIALSNLQQRLDDDPKYHLLKFTSKSLPLNEIQSRYLQRGEAIISFYYTGSELICFFLTKTSFGYVSSAKDPPLAKNILRLRQLLGDVTIGSRKDIDSLSNYLYSVLMQPVINKLKGIQHLLVIPYNEICYVPFELLADPANQEPLLRKLAIRYDYSVNFIAANKSAGNDYKVLAMAPFTKDDAAGDFQTLSASMDEVKNLRGKVLVDSDATKATFIELSSSYPIIHLATHAVADDRLPMQSFIAFYGSQSEELQQRLYEQEIYNLDLLHVRLVILSACETGSGKLVNGEGMMSLSRAFSFAGCKSVLASLWKADDAATAFITRRMHHYLQNGDRKDVALQKAKIDYLDNGKIEARHKIPSYWSHLVLIGDGQPVSKKSSIMYFLVNGGLILLVLLYTYFRRRKR